MDHLDLEQIQRLLRARLSAEERAQAIRHLRGCADCYQALEDERRFSSLLALDVLPDVDVDIQKLVKKVSQRSRSPRFGWILAGAGMFLLATVSGFATGRRITSAQIQIDATPMPGVSADLETEVAGNMDAIRLIRTNYDLVQEIDMLRIFDQLLEERPEQP